MKKLIYSLAVVLMGLSSCTSFDDPTTENYGAGPAIDVNITPGAQSDSVFTVNITPAAGTVYYAYIIDENDKAEEINGYTMLKGGYGNTVVNVEQQPSLTITIDEATPNTTYQVYAVAANDKGIIGDVVVKSITTTDKLAPGEAVDIAKDTESGAVQLTFKESLVRGTGAVTAKYYKEWDILNPVDVAADNITVNVAGNTVEFVASDVPDGAYICYSYEAGAFKDNKGNACEPLQSGLDMNKGVFTGAWIQKDTKAFDVNDEMVTAPEDGALIANLADFKGEITFPFDIYRNDEYVQTGDLAVTFTSEAKTATYKLTASDWSVDGKVLSFNLPANAIGEAGDLITVSLIEGAITDVYGNPNNAFTSKTSWKYFSMTKEMAFGRFSLDITYQGKASNLGNFSIVDAATEEQPTQLLFKDFYLEGSELTGYYDLKAGKVYMNDGQVVGLYTNSKGTTYGLVFYNADNDTDDEVPVPFTVNADGSMVADAVWGMYAYSEDFSEPLGWFEIAQTSAFNPIEANSARKVSGKFLSVKKAAKKTMKLSKAARNSKKRVSK